jgi:hypothetical protein
MAAVLVPVPMLTFPFIRKPAGGTMATAEVAAATAAAAVELACSLRPAGTIRRKSILGLTV